MDFNNFITKLKEKIISLYTKVYEYCQENTRNAIIYASLGCFVLILLILILCLSSPKKTKIENRKNIVLTEDLLIPDGPELFNDYNISRETQDKWSDEEAETWFEVPETKDITSLEKANDTIISDIIGAAP